MRGFIAPMTTMDKASGLGSTVMGGQIFFDSTSTGVAARAIEANLHDIEQNRLVAQGSMPTCIRIELVYQ